jgi:hypothetical protein
MLRGLRAPLVDSAGANSGCQHSTALQGPRQRPSRRVLNAGLTALGARAAAHTAPGHQTCRAEVARCNEVEKTLRIVVTSGLVNQARFTKGIRESLAAPLERARPARNPASHPAHPAPRITESAPVPPCGRWE